MIALVRHAKAGERGSAHDDLRPLTAPGRRQASGLVDQLALFKFDRILSSPYVRCRQTVEPLAEARGLAVLDSDLLAEGASPDRALDLMAQLAEVGAALCSHGDVIVGVIMELADRGVIAVPDLRAAKGSTWLIEFRGRNPLRARYLAPPFSG